MTTLQNQTGILSKSYGIIWNNIGNYTGSSFSFTNSYQELAGISGAPWALVSPSKNFSMTTDGQLKYTGENTLNFIISSYFSTSQAAKFSTAIYKNGALLTESESPEDSIKTSIIKNSTVSMAKNDYISLYGARATSNSAGIVQMHVTIESA